MKAHSTQEPTEMRVMPALVQRVIAASAAARGAVERARVALRDPPGWRHEVGAPERRERVRREPALAETTVVPAARPETEQVAMVGAPEVMAEAAQGAAAEAARGAAAEAARGAAAEAARGAAAEAARGMVGMAAALGWRRIRQRARLAPPTAAAHGSTMAGPIPIVHRSLARSCSTRRSF